MSTMVDHVLEVEGVTKRYGSFALQGVSFSLPRGYIMGFIGQNGAGKSTTMKCIMNLIPYDSGSIRLFGQEHRSDPTALRQRIGYVSEELTFYEEMTVEWTGKFVSRFYEHWDHSYWRQLLGQFHVEPRKRVKELSRGMKMKLAISLAMAHRPELLILDEPTSGLDPVIRTELLTICREIIQDERCSIFFSSHITSDIERIADYVTVIRDGSILASSDKDQLLDEWRLIRFDKGHRSPELESLMQGFKTTEFSCSGIVKDPDAFSRIWRQRHPGASFQSERMTLDELLIRFAPEEGVRQ